MTIGSSVWYYFIYESSWQVFGSAALQGAGCATLLITSLSMTADLIGCHTVS